MNKTRMGSNLLGILNDLKRDPETAARELGIPLEILKSYIKGENEIPHELIVKAAEIWPVNIRDLYNFEDDAPEGVLVMTREESERSSRTLKRGGVDYYEYRDTAMSRSALFRPEWIKELVVVDDNNPFNEALAWNNGHLLHQFTYFVGPVNFYYDINGERFCAEMSTGDSMYIAPYVPHTFTTRRNKEGKLGLIIAVTFGGKLMGDAQQELGVLGENLARGFLLDYPSKYGASGSLIRGFREQLSMPPEVLKRETSLPLELIAELESGRRLPTNEELELLASALGVSRRDLIPIDSSSKVEILKYAKARRWSVGCYNFFELANTRHLPYSNGIELTLKKDGDGSQLKTTSQQYIYNVGDSDVNISWGYMGEESQTTLRPDDSTYIKPNIGHRFRSVGGSHAKLLVMRIGSRISGDAQHELSLIDRRGLDRVVGESTQWYDPKGKR